MSRETKPVTLGHGPDVSRRGFLLGSAITFAIVSQPAALLRSAWAESGPRRVTAWVDIAPDETITILSAGAEMGQGSMTSVAVVLAEEMDADWSKVRIDWAPADAAVYGYDDRGKPTMTIIASRAVEGYYPVMRFAGAQVRKILLGAVAEMWNVPVGELTTEPSTVIHGPSGRRISYGQVAATAKMPADMPPVERGELKKETAFRLVGTSLPRHDIPGKTDGSARFAMDVQLSGMVYATTLHSPVHGGEPQKWNSEEIAAQRGILATVKLPTGVAIAGDTVESILAARSKLKVEWSKSKASGYDSEKALDQAYVRVATDSAYKVQKVDVKGDVAAAFAGAAKTFKADFRSDYGYHAQMEPLNAVARFNAAGDHVEVWDGTQAPEEVRLQVAEALGFNKQQVTFHQCYMGGSFGRRTFGDYTVEAALCAREIKKPVKLIWPREEDIAYGMFRPQSYQTLEAAVDAAGKVVGWRHCSVGDGRELQTSGMKVNRYYDLPNYDLELRPVSDGVRVKHWRATGRAFNIFAIEELVDRMAVALAIDPLEFRLKNMSATPRARAVLEKVAEMSRWHVAREPERALGLSIAERGASVGAAVAEVSLDKSTGKIAVHKVWMAVDSGTIVQPDAAKANIESAIVQGLSSVLLERITVKDGAVEQSNFHDYPLLRMADAPEEIHIEFVNASRGAPLGLGEIGNPPMPPAIASAFHRLTGKRLQHMPFTEEKVLSALRA